MISSKWKLEFVFEFLEAMVAIVACISMLATTYSIAAAISINTSATILLLKVSIEDNVMTQLCTNGIYAKCILSLLLIHILVFTLIVCSAYIPAVDNFVRLGAIVSTIYYLYRCGNLYYNKVKPNKKGEDYAE